MKIFTTILFLLLVSAFAGYAQAPTDSLRTRGDKSPPKSQKVKKSDVDFKASYAAGKDSIQGKDSLSKAQASKEGKRERNRRRNRLRDKFIDEDGDGINDNRCKGVGLNNFKRTPPKFRRRGK